MESSNMSEINIVFSKEELSLLLKLLYSGSFVVEADDEEKDKNINSIIQKVLLSAKINKAYRGIEFNQKTNEYELSEKADETLNEEFDEFVEKVRKLKKSSIVYIFSWEKEFEFNDFDDDKNITIKTIPQPILEIYKQIYNLV